LGIVKSDNRCRLSGEVDVGGDFVRYATVVLREVEMAQEETKVVAACLHLPAAVGQADAVCNAGMVVALLSRIRSLSIRELLDVCAEVRGVAAKKHLVDVVESAAVVDDKVREASGRELDDVHCQRLIG